MEVLEDFGTFRLSSQVLCKAVKIDLFLANNPFGAEDAFKCIML